MPTFQLCYKPPKYDKRKKWIIKEQYEYPDYYPEMNKHFYNLLNHDSMRGGGQVMVLKDGKEYCRGKTPESTLRFG